MFIVIPVVIGYMWFKKSILDGLPPISNIEKVVFSQTTTITDRNWVVLYKVFNENRQYVPFNKISKNIQNAIVAIEDKHFWENPGVDIQWIIRAWIHDIIFGRKQWWSTLTQQLIKNLLLTNEKTIKRKLKEIVLAFKLNDYLSSKVKRQYKWLSDEDIKKKIKEIILEMYLNYVFFWNNTYWIQAASKVYFHKDAINLTVLESAILSSIPKSPVKYDPITNRNNNLWQLIVYNISGDEISLTWSFWNLIKDVYIKYLQDQSFVLLKTENNIIKALSPNSLYYKNIHIVYKPWRKDFVLSRMYIDWYIDKNQFIQAIKEGFDKEIYKPKIEIKAPWFVFYVLDKLNKEYWKDVVSKAGWTIKTSLDWNIQLLAEQSVKDFSDYLEEKWANNTALLYVDTKNWDILAYIGSKDYYNKEIDWQVDMIIAKRQCWSVIKPLIYANAFIKNKYFTPDTPVYDVKFDIAEKGNTFNNFDWKFLWLLPLRKALSYSRNIPAAKMYFLWGGEHEVKKFLQSIWLETVSDKIYYGYPLAIGAVEVRMLDMAQAYSYLSNIDGARSINPILEIRGPNWNLIYKKEDKKLPQIVPPGVISILWYILSNSNNRPPTWNGVMQIPSLKLATKSWTTNIIDKKTWKKYPRDGWFVAYSPSKVFVTWAWNTKWEPMHQDAYGGWTAWKVWRDFVLKLQKAGYIKDEDMLLKWTTSIYVNTLNWKKSSQYTPVQVSHKTIARINWIPLEDDWKTVKMMQIDTLCNWVVSKYTPESDKKYAYVVYPNSLKKDDFRWEEPMLVWWSEKWIKIYEKLFNWPVLLSEPTNICEEREIVAKKWTLNFQIEYPKNNQNISYVFDLRLKILNKPFAIKTVEIYIDNKLLKKIDWKNYIISIYLPNDIPVWQHTITIILKDDKWYSKEQQLKINLVKEDKDKPFLDQIVKQNWKYIYIFKDEYSRVLWWTLDCDWKKIKFSWPVAVAWSKNCEWMVVDYYGN